MVTAEGWQLNQGQTKELLAAGRNGKEEEDECVAFIRSPVLTRVYLAITCQGH